MRGFIMKKLLFFSFVLVNAFACDADDQGAQPFVTPPKAHRPMHCPGAPKKNTAPQRPHP
jgi:hypothetical protein